jgi:hypothetical protein
MTLPDTTQLLYIALILVGLGILWIVLKFLLRFTMRFFACGCLGLLVLGAIAYWIIT